MQKASNNSLFASSILLFAMILFAASRRSPVALAEASNTYNGYTMVTTPGGQGTDLLYLIDDQHAVLMVYDVPNPQSESVIRPLASWSLSELFSTVRK